MKKILVTGAAGFIGFHLSKALLSRGDKVIGLDNLNDYYDVNLKLARLEQLKPHEQFSFHKMDLCDNEAMADLFAKEQFDVVVNLAAQAGVRYSLENPHSYISANVTGFLNILEGCRHNKVSNLVYASSSSVYGANEAYPFTEHMNVDHPISLYAATKRSDEMMAHCYAHLFGVPCTGLRFFTVYGPWGRPDMALFKFTKNTFAGEPIDVYNHGDMLRDFTYVDDIVSGVICTIDNPAKPNSEWSGEKPDPATSYAPARVYNIGNGSPVRLMEFIDEIEANVGKEAVKNYMPLQPGDVPKTFADTTLLQQDFGFKPQTSIKEGVKAFVDWYKAYYKIKETA